MNLSTSVLQASRPTNSEIDHMCPHTSIGRGCDFIVYTVVMGRQHAVMPPFETLPEQCAIMITNDKANARQGWTLHLITASCIKILQKHFPGGLRVVSRWWKIMSHLFFEMPTIHIDSKPGVGPKKVTSPSHNRTYWKEAHKSILADVLFSCNASFAAFEHPTFANSIVSEYEAILRYHVTATPVACKRDLEEARANPLLNASGRLIDGSFLLRRPSKALALLERKWWSTYIKRGCDRDQPAFARTVHDLYGPVSHRCGQHPVHIMAFEGRGTKHQSWSDTSLYCHYRAGWGTKYIAATHKCP